MSVGISVALGTITGCFGGVLRDILSSQKPLIFLGEIYAMAAVTGGFLFVGILHVTGSELSAQITGIVAIVLIRYLAVTFKLGLPKFYHD